MNRADRRRWMRRHIAAELSARAVRARTSDPAAEYPAATSNGLPFEFGDDETPPVHGAGAERPRTERPAPGPASAGRPAEDVLLGAAREAAQHGDTARAERVYRELLELHPEHVRGRTSLARLLDDAGRHEAALEELDQCLALEPDNAQALVHRGAVLGTLARFAEAERSLRYVLRLEPTNAEAHYHLGVVISRKGLWRDAIGPLRRTVELDSGRAAGYYYLGEALNHVDDLDGALQSFQRAAELRPNHPPTLYGLGIVLDRLNRPGEAAQMYRRSRAVAGP